MGTSPLIAKYMAKHFIWTFLVVFMILLMLAYLFDSIELLRRTSSKEMVTFIDVLKMAGLKSFSMFHLLLPFAVLISALFMLWRLGKSHELIVIRASGVSVWQFLTPLLGVAFGIGVLNVCVINPLAASTYKNFERMEMKFDISSVNPFDLSNQGLWIREIRDNTQYLVRAAHVLHKNDILQFKDLSIFRTSLNDHFEQRIDAKRGELRNERFYLSDVWVLLPDEMPTHLDNLDLSTKMTKETIENSFSSPETLSFWKIPAFINFFEKTGFSSLKHRLYWYSLLFSPFFLLSMVLIAAAFSLKITQRQGGILVRIVLALSAGFGLFFFSKLAYALGASASVPLALSTITPSLIAICSAVFILLHYEDGKA